MGENMTGLFVSPIVSPESDSGLIDGVLISDYTPPTLDTVNSIVRIPLLKITSYVG